MRFLCFVLILAAAGVAAYSVFSAHTETDKYATLLKNYQAQTQQLEQLSQRVVELEHTSAQPNAVPTLTATPTQAPVATSTPAPATVEAALSVMQNQYSSFLSIVGFLFTVIAIVTAIISVLLPIFNYSFVQKDQVQKMEQKTDEFKGEVEGMKAEFNRQLKAFQIQSEADRTRLENMIIQGTKATEATLETDNRDVKIPSLSDSPKDRAQALYMQALVNLRKKDYRSVYNALSEAIDLDQSIAIYPAARGATLNRMKRYDDALLDLERAIELDPNNAVYLDWRGATLLKLKRYEDAIADAKKAIKLNPKNAEYPALVARCYISLCKFTQAKPFLDKALTLDPANSYALRVRGQYHLALANTGLTTVPVEEMQADFDQDISSDNENPFPLIYRAQFFLHTKQYDLALKDLTRAHELDPLEPEVDHTFAQYYEAIGDTAKAKEYNALATQHGYIPEP